MGVLKSRLGQEYILGIAWFVVKGEESVERIKYVQEVGHSSVTGVTFGVAYC